MSNRIRVFLNDDQLIVGETIKEMLSTEGDIDFEYCPTPIKALQSAVEFKPTVILQDLTMPEIDGLTLLKFYRANKDLRHVPVIVLSAKYEPEIKVKAFDNGANDYFEKRFEIEGIEKELIARLRYHSNAYLTRLERDAAYNTLEQEIKKAAEYIHSILPKPINDNRVTTEWRHIPSTSLSGDSFDYFWIDDNNFAFYILDVCGHGIGSALLSISAVNVLRSSDLTVEEFKQPAKVLTFLNDKFQMSRQNDLYFTIWYGVYNNKTRNLKYSGGAHPPAILISGDNIKHLESKNFLIGGLPNFEFSESNVMISPNSELFIYTDGAYEIMKQDETMWTLEEFSEYIRENDSQDILDKLYKFLQNLGNRKHLEDDYTILKLNFY